MHGRTILHTCARVALAAVWLFLALGLVSGPTLAQSSLDQNRYMVIFDRDRILQGRHGDIRFTVVGNLKAQPDIHACLRWKAPLQPDWTDPVRVCGLSQNLPVRRIKESQDPPGVVYAITIPRSFPDAPSNVEYFARFVPIAELAIFSNGDSGTRWHEVRDVGITSRCVASAAAILSILIAGAILFRCAQYLQVPGPETPKGIRALVLQALRGFSVPLRIISSASGWASLSQFQIILWTFVVGAGAVYVMTLTGSLIAISAGTLTLLGIAGAAAVLSEVKAQAQPPASLTPPGAVTNLAPTGTPSPTDIAISWSPPVGGSTPTAYVVQYKDPATPGVWRTVTTALRGTSLLRGTGFRIVGLAPDTPYEVQVIATNSAGSGPPVALPAVRTAQGTLPPPSVKGLRVGSGITGTSVPLIWDPVAGGRYTVEAREHDGDAVWMKYTDIGEAQTTITGLRPNSAYDFRVSTTAASQAWSSVQTILTGARVPKWSDIVTDTDKPAEIDVTRVQMLFFTVISAVFVGLNIVGTGTIPAIDPTYVTLMGISNGVYVTAKFVRP